jgi:hypothetical protein
MKSANDAKPLSSLPSVVELNTMSDLRPDFRDETPRVFCSKCRHHFLLGHDMRVDPVVSAISYKHLELCEGDPAVTLWKIDQWFKREHRNP